MRLTFLLVALLLAGFWSVLKWLGLRTFDASDEPWGLLSLLTLLFLLIIEAKSRSKAAYPPDLKASFLVLSISFLVFIAGYSCLPMLLQSVLFAFTLFLLIESRSISASRFGTLSLLLMSLPLMPSLNFYLAFPLRLFCSSLASLMLRFCGLPVEQKANLLFLNGQAISVDAPCSGINMLWAAAYLASVLSCVKRLNWLRTVALFSSSFVLIIIANSMRVAALALFSFKQPSLDPAIVSAESIVHLGAGLSLFVFVAAAQYFIAARLGGRSSESPRRDLLFKTSNLPLKPLLALVIVLSAVAAFLPFLPHVPATAPEIDPVWPDTINGKKIEALANTEEDTLFGRAFPGRIKRFSDGKNAYVIRWIKSESRQVHSARDCYKGMGYVIENGPLIKSDDGQFFVSFLARKGARTYRVKERIYDESGNSWTDPSDWYWAAALGKSKGPWWDLTIAEPLAN